MSYISGRDPIEEQLLDEVGRLRELLRLRTKRAKALEAVAKAARRVLPSVNDPSLFDTLRKALATLDEAREKGVAK